MDDSFFVFLAFLCIAVLLFYIRRVSNRSREHTEKLIDTAASLTSRVHALEQQLKSLTEVTSGLVAKLYEAGRAASATEAHPAQAPPVQAPASTPQPKPVAPSVAPASAGEAVHAPKIGPVAPPPSTIAPLPAAPATQAASAAAEQEKTAALAAQIGSALAQKASASTAAAPPLPPPPVARVQTPTNVPFENYAARSTRALPITIPK